MQVHAEHLLATGTVSMGTGSRHHGLMWSHRLPFGRNMAPDSILSPSPHVQRWGNRVARDLGLAPSMRGNQVDVNPREGAPVLSLLASRQLSLELSKRLKGHGLAGASTDGKQGEQLRQGQWRVRVHLVLLKGSCLTLPSTSAHLTPASPNSPVPLPCP